MRHLLLFNKPFGVMCRYTDSSSRPTLARFIHFRNVYAAGRLDYDSEGLVILTNTGFLRHLISHPRHKLPKTYWAQVEGSPNADAPHRLEQRIVLLDGPARALKAATMAESNIWTRIPPIRWHKNVPFAWISLTIAIGRHRIVRRMTAAIGLPTLRLIRQAIGPWQLGSLEPGQWQEIPCPVNREEFIAFLSPSMN